MTYQTLHQWNDGFAGQIIITMPAGRLPASWRLRLSYRSAAPSVACGAGLGRRVARTW